MIGLGCHISDTDAHPINYIDRRSNNIITNSVPITSGNDVFIGA